MQEGTEPRAGDAARIRQDGRRLRRGQLEAFHRDGYLILESMMSTDLIEQLKDEVDRWVDGGLRQDSIRAAVDPDRSRPPSVVEIELPAHGRLACLPDLLEVVAELIGDRFGFHHMHSARHDPDASDKAWHHDYEGLDPTSREYAMVHTLHYVNGLSPNVPSLVVLPGSHMLSIDKKAYIHRGTGKIHGEHVIEFLPPGTTVLAHSALLHARRSNGVGGRSRYFIDASYCQRGTQWRPAKPYWRHILRRAREMNLGTRRWPDLFAESHFVEYVRPMEGT